MNYSRRILFLFIGVALLFGIGYLRTMTSGNTEEALRHRIVAEWEAKKNRNFGAVYDMAAEAYRQKVSRDIFLQRKHVGIQKFSVKSLEMSESGKEALSEVEFTTKQMGFDFTFKSKESWVWEGGEWRLDISVKPLKLPGMK